MNTTPSRIRWRIAPEKSDAEDRQQPEIPDAGTRQVTDKMTVLKGIFQPSHLGSAEAEAWHPDNLAKPGAQPRDDEAEARRIATELARLHRDGAIASKSAHDLDAVFYARLLRDFGATCTGRSGPRQNAPKILPDGEFAPRPGAENQWKVPDPPPGLNWAERQKFYMDDLRDAIGDEWITAPPGCPATGVLIGSEGKGTAEMTRAGTFGR